MSSHPVPTESLNADSPVKKRSPFTVLSLAKAKQRGQKVVSLTCYDYSTARLLDEAGVDILLVGDSLAMTVLGHPNTLSVTVDEMLHHVKAVSRGTSKALVLADLPFMSYQISKEEAVRNAGRFIQEGHAGAVKLEGASPLVLDVIAHLSAIGIPVVAHLGFTPQSVLAFGGFRVQAKQLNAAKQLIEDVRNVQDAGAVALVLEMVPKELASFITQRLTIPTIGIGAGSGCDGQVLVVDDFLGRYGRLSPRFARRYVNSEALIQDAVERYRDNIQSGCFPDDETEAFAFPAVELDQLEALFAGFS